VTGQAWVEPEPSPLDRISPSSLNAFDQCPKRLAFRRDPRTRGWSKRSTRSALGIVSHALTEAVLRGEAPESENRRPWLEQRWDELIAEQLTRIRADWPGRAVPEAPLWRGYVATRTRLLRRLETEPGIGFRAPRAAGSGGLPELPWVEFKLYDDVTGIFGTPDRVEIRDELLRVVDLKSGVHQSDASDTQWRQLLLYAHLVYTKLGRRPDVLVVQDARGREHTASAPMSAVERAVEAAVSTVAAFNGMTAARQVPAHPGQDQCGFCEFRVVCEEYWATRGEDWHPLDAWGTVESVDGEVVHLAPDAQDASGVVRVILCEGASVTPGGEVVVANLDRAGPATGRMRWDSPLRVGAC